MRPLGRRRVALADDGHRWLMTDSRLANTLGAIKVRGEACWWVPVTYTWLVRLQEERAVGIDPELAEGLVEVAERPLAGLVAYNLVGDPGLHEDLLEHQLEAVAHAARADSHLLADEPGLGKTLSALSAVEYWDAFPCLVVAPKSVLRTWRREVQRWYPHRSARLLEAGSRHGLKPEDLAAHDYTVTNWEAVRLMAGQVPWAGAEKGRKAATEPGLLNHVPWATVVADEAHRLRNASSQTRAVWGIKADHRLALTGTPVDELPDELWGILRWLSRVDWPAKGRLVDRYCAVEFNPHSPHPQVEGLLPYREDEWHRLLAYRMMRRTKAILDIPDRLPPEAVYVDMQPSEREAYDTMRDELYAMMEDGSYLEAVDVLSQLTRLMQLAAGTARVEVLDKLDQRGWPKVRVQVSEPSSKVEALAQWVRDQDDDEPAVVFVYHRDVATMAAKALAPLGQVVRITGAETAAERAEAEERFQSGTARFVVCSYAAAGEGLTLHRARNLLVLQRPWSRIQEAQGQDRVHRIGQERQVRRVDFVSADTVEERQLERLREKHEGASLLLGDPLEDLGRLL